MTINRVAPQAKRTPGFSSQWTQAARGRASADERSDFHRISFALSHVLAEDAPYTGNERLLVLAIVRRMAREGQQWICFVSHEHLAKTTGISARTVARSLKRHCEGPAPLLKRITPPPGHLMTTRGHQHGCARFELVTDPRAFAAARDQARQQQHPAKKKRRQSSTPPPPMLSPVSTDPELARPAAALTQAHPTGVDAGGVVDGAELLRDTFARIAALPRPERRRRNERTQSPT